MTQILNFTITVINKLKAQGSNRKVKNIQDHIVNISREIKIKRIKQKC